MLGRDVLVLQALRFVEGALKHVVRRLAEVLLGDAGNLGQPLDLLFDLASECGGRSSQLFEQRRDHSISLGDERPQQMQRLDLLLPGASAHFLRRLEGFLGLYGKFVESQHDVILSLSEVGYKTPGDKRLKW